MEPRRARRRNAVLSALETFWGLHYDITLPQILVLLYVAKHGTVTQAELSDRLGLFPATASRAVRMYADADWRFALPPAAGLLEFRIAGDNNRLNLIGLSPKGRDFVARLDGWIDEGGQISGEISGERS